MKRIIMLSLLKCIRSQRVDDGNLNSEVEMRPATSSAESKSEFFADTIRDICNSGSPAIGETTGFRTEKKLLISAESVELGKRGYNNVLGLP